MGVWGTGSEICFNTTSNVCKRLGETVILIFSEVCWLQIKDDELVKVCGKHGRNELHTGFWWENLKSRELLGNHCLELRIILVDLKKYGVSRWSGCIWLRIAKTGGLFWRWQWTVGFHGLWEVVNSWETISSSRSTLLQRINYFGDWWICMKERCKIPIRLIFFN